MSDYTPGNGARTLRWVPGMLTTSGWRCVCHGMWTNDLGHSRIVAPQAQAALVPDLTDRATFLLALDQLAERQDWPHEAGVWFRPLPAPEGVWSLYGGGNRRRRFGLEPRLTPDEALDRALWLTREATP